MTKTPTSTIKLLENKQKKQEPKLMTSDNSNDINDTNNTNETVSGKATNVSDTVKEESDMAASSETTDRTTATSETIDYTTVLDFQDIIISMPLNDNNEDAESSADGSRGESMHASFTRRYSSDSKLSAASAPRRSSFTKERRASLNSVLSRLSARSLSVVDKDDDEDGDTNSVASIDSEDSIETTQRRRNSSRSSFSTTLSVHQIKELEALYDECEADLVE